MAAKPRALVALPGGRGRPSGEKVYLLRRIAVNSLVKKNWLEIGMSTGLVFLMIVLILGAQMALPARAEIFELCPDRPALHGGHGLCRIETRGHVATLNINIIIHIFLERGF
ncbi:MAG: hypothetical protein MZV63_33380 [Marinilabiliales bacterium]|nr:hypothetical protein [Marinilabiliales bacterium]